MDFHKQLVQIAHEMDWEDLTDHGSGSCVASHGCADVTQSDLYEYGDRIRAAVLAESAQESSAWSSRSKTGLLRGMSIEQALKRRDQ